MKVILEVTLKKKIDQVAVISNDRKIPPWLLEATSVDGRRKG